MKMIEHLDLTGRKFGRLLVISLADKKNKGEGRSWICKCDCGNEVKILQGNLISGSTRSCGCLRKEMASKKFLKHGHTHRNGKETRTYKAWCSLRARCQNEKYWAYHLYGGRGIKVCERWDSFENFLEDMGECPLGMTLERIDNNNDYYKENCRWATKKEQARNTSTNHMIEYKGETKCLSAWAEEKNIASSTLWQRLFHLKWSIEKSLTHPVRKRMASKQVYF